MQLHEKISLFRKVKGWTQEEMAEKLGMSEHGYSDIERGKTDMQVSRLEQIANAFDIEVSDLFSMNERAVFNLAVDWHDSCVQNNYMRPSSVNLEHELEKARLLIAQRDKEIAYLNTIIELTKTAQGGNRQGE